MCSLPVNEYAAAATVWCTQVANRATVSKKMHVSLMNEDTRMRDKCHEN